VQKTTGSRRDQMLLFARNFLKHPRMLGSVIPSSRFLIDGLLKHLDFNRARVIVEYGPGVGTITTHVLKRMHPDAKLVVIEMNDDFVRFLRENVRDPRLHVVHGSAADVGPELKKLGYDRADYAISGIPFSTMPPEVRADILQKTNAVLDPQGAFLVYQFSPSIGMHLERAFGQVTRTFEPLNIPPAQLYVARPRAVA
jgi:phospholipid N-methyltransferase